MFEKITLDLLTSESVSVKTQAFIVYDGVEHPIGKPHRKSYINSARGREMLLQELSEPQLSAVLAVWGDKPTVEDMNID